MSERENDKNGSVNSKCLLPDSWNWSVLNELGLVQLGKTPSKSDYRNSGDYKIIKFRDVEENGVIDWDRGDKGYVDSAEKTRRLLKELQKDDVLVTASAHMSEHIGKKVGIVNKIPQKYKKAYFVGEILQIRVNEKCVPKWMFYFLQSSDGYKAIQRRVHGVHLIASRAKNIEIPIATPSEQKLIIAEIEKQFSRLDEAVTALKRIKANLKRYKASVLKSAVEGKLTEEWRKQHPNVEPANELLKRILTDRRKKWEEANPKKKYKEPSAPDTSNLPALPKGWVWGRLEQLTERITKGSSPNWQGFSYVSNGIPFVRSQNVIWGKMDLSDIAHLPKEFNQKESKSILKAGDVLLNIVGASIGRSAVATNEVQGGNVNQAVAIIRLIENGMNNIFLMNYLISGDAQTIINLEKVDVARANLSLADIANLVVPLPPYMEQAIIVDEIEKSVTSTNQIFSEIDRALKRAKRLRQSILKKAFSGKLVPHDKKPLN